MRKKEFKKVKKKTVNQIIFPYYILIYVTLILSTQSMSGNTLRNASNQILVTLLFTLGDGQGRH